MKSHVRSAFRYTGLFLMVFVLAFGLHAGWQWVQTRATYNEVESTVTEYFNAVLHRNIRKQMSMAVWQAIPPKQTYQALYQQDLSNPVLRYRIVSINIIGPNEAEVFVSSAIKGVDGGRMLPPSGDIEVVKNSRGTWTLFFPWN